MAPVTQVKNLKIFNWSRPTAINPRLAAPITASATTITVTNAPLDESDTIVSVDFLMGIKNISTGFVETVFVPATGISVDGLTFTNCVRGIDVSGLDYNTGNTALTSAHGQDSTVFCVIHPFNHNQWQAALQGTIASGGNNWKIGDGTDSDIKVIAYNADADKPFWMYDKATSQWVFSNDGTSTTPFGTGAGVTGGDGITVTAGDIDIDLTDTTIFKDARTGNEARAVVTKAATGLIDTTFLPTSSTIPTGTVQMYVAAAAPSGWLLCDGSAVDRTTYATLFAVIGTSYGSGDGATTFNVPDFRGRSPIGYGTGTGGGATGTGVPTGGSALTAVALGRWKGAETHTLTTAEMPAHTHTFTYCQGGAAGVTDILQMTANTGGTKSTASAGSGTAHNNIQPVMGINFIIKS